MVRFAKVQTITDYETGVAMMLYKIQFFNAGIVPVFCACFGMSFFGPSGMVNQVSQIFFMNTVLSNGLLILDFKWWIKRAKLFCLLRNFKKNNRKAMNLTQREVNEMHERQDFSLSLKYSAFLKNLSLSIYYLPILPMGCVFAIACNIITLFILNWTLAKRTNKRVSYSTEICKTVSREFSFCLMLFCCGLITKEFIVCYVN